MTKETAAKASDLYNRINYVKGINDDLKKKYERGRLDFETIASPPIFLFGVALHDIDAKMLEIADAMFSYYRNKRDNELQNMEIELESLK